MKNFCEATVTKNQLMLEIRASAACTINGQETDYCKLALKSKIVISANPSTVVTVDGIEILPKYQHLTDNGLLIIDNFYPWLHTVSGQGWIV